MTRYQKGLIAVLATWGVFFTTMWPRMLFYGKTGIMGYTDLWSDWAAHFGYAATFAYRSASDWFLSHPFFVHQKFTYPFLVDAISGLLIKSGLDQVASFVIPSIVLSLLLIIVLYTFYFEHLKSPKQAFLALTLFLANGSLGFIYFFSEQGDYSRLDNHDIYWYNIVSCELLPQRSFLLGIVLALTIIILLQKWMTKKIEHTTCLKLILLSILTSLLMLCHVYSLVILLLIACALFLFNRHYHYYFIIYIGLSLALSLILYVVFFSGGTHLSSFHWRLGWMSDVRKTNIFYFWLLNFGLFLPIALVGIWKKKLITSPIILVSVILFILANVVQFQTWDWDTTKILTWGYLIFCIPVVTFLADIWKRNHVAKVFVVLIVLSMTATGFWSLARTFRTHDLSYSMWTYDEIKLADAFRQESKPTDIVLTSDDHHHFIPTLTGRPIVMGYRGWLWSYGFNYNEEEKDISGMYSGTNNAYELLKKYQIRYVVIGPSERANFNVNETFFSTQFEKILEDKNYRIYKIN